MKKKILTNLYNINYEKDLISIEFEQGHFQYFHKTGCNMEEGKMKKTKIRKRKKCGEQDVRER
jgi:hypothetical protein